MVKFNSKYIFRNDKCSYHKNFVVYWILLNMKGKKMFLSGTNRFFKQVATRMGVETSFVDCTVIDNVKKAMKPNTKVF